MSLTYTDLLTSLNSSQLPETQWGFDPVSFGPNNRKGQTIINARSETALQLPSFRGPLCERPESRRCVIPSTGFYEWYKQPGPGKTEREPFLCRLGNNENAMMAGIYDIQTSEQADYTSSFVILTAAASNGFAWLHDRQPCLLSSEDEINGWLDSGKVSPKQAVSGLRIATNIFCTRMLSDLSKESTNQKKPRREGDIKSFFTAKTTSTNNTEVRVDSHSLSKASSSAVRKPISKRRNAAGKTGQSHISSFFSASPRRS